MRIAQKTKIAGAVLIGGFVAVLGAGAWTIRTLEVGGPIYNQIVLGKDLVADILPPPAYVVESFLEVTEALNEPGSVDKRRETLVRLHKEYTTRQEYWRGQEFDPKVRELLTKEADAPALQFWKLTEGDFLPALARGDMEGARKVFAEIRAAYHEHREKIDKTVAEANRMTAEVEAESGRIKLLNLSAIGGIALLMLAVAVGAVASVLLGVIRPLDQIASSLVQLAVGKTDVTFVGNGRKDEIGEMAGAADIFRENTLERTRLEVEQRSAREKELHRQGQVELLVNDFKNGMARLAATLDEQVGKMRAVSGSLSSTAQTTVSQAGSASEASAGAADNSQAVASATEQLQASIKEISAQAHQTNSIVSAASEGSRKSDADVAGLAEATDRIGSIVELIRNIAQQTNLLALNATIESARAGEAGKGFAVVASEVKNLASQTAKATDEISQQIAEVQTLTRAAVDTIRGVSTKVSEINGLTGAIAAAVEQQEAATREIAQNVTMAADRSKSAATDVGALGEAAAQTQKEANTVSGMSAQLAQVADDMKKALERFVEALSSDLNERRKHWRQKSDWPVMVTMGGRHFETDVIDASVAGLRIKAFGEMKADQDVEVDWGEGTCRATVVWSNQEMAGIQFVAPLAKLPARPVQKGEKRAA